jgi:predicted homoserine dehydrogenase-like protein
MNAILTTLCRESKCGSFRIAWATLVTDPSGRYAALYKPYHLIGLELGVSVARVGLRGESTGVPTGFRGDAVATAKRDLAGGEVLDDVIVDETSTAVRIRREMEAAFPAGIA